MELRQLRYFVTIVDYGSISRASGILHIAQPALSHQLQLLERDLEAPLLHRSSRGVTPTEAGKKFYQHAQAILKQVLDARASVTQTTNNPTGTVALGIPQSVSGVLALPLLKAVHERYPSVTLQLTEELTANLVEPIKSGRLNLAILFDERQYPTLSVTPLVEEELVFITPAGVSHVVDNNPIELAAALSSRLILPDKRNGVRPIIDSAASDSSIELRDVVEINSVTILRSALLADIGATIAPASAFISDLESGALRSQVISDKLLSRRLMLCASKNIPLSDGAIAIKNLVRTVVVDLCLRGVWAHTHLLYAPD